MILNGGGAKPTIAERCDMIRQVGAGARLRLWVARRWRAAQPLLLLRLHPATNSSAVCFRFCCPRPRAVLLLRAALQPGSVCCSPVQAMESSTSDYDREKLQERLAKLSGGVAVLKVRARGRCEAGAGCGRASGAWGGGRAGVGALCRV